MAELTDQPTDDFERFATRRLALVVAVFLRAAREPALAYDLATETLAAARLRWETAPAPAERTAWLLEIGATVLATAIERGRVPSNERRRGREPAPCRLTVAQQHELMSVAEARLECPAGALVVADALARDAPPMHVLRELRRSELVEAEPLPDRARERDGH